MKKIIFLILLAILFSGCGKLEAQTCNCVTEDTCFDEFGGRCSK